MSSTLPLNQKKQEQVSKKIDFIQQWLLVKNPKTILIQERLNWSLEEEEGWYQLGMLALWEIRRYQTSTDLLIRKLTFQCLCQEICEEIPGVRGKEVTVATLMALQETKEYYLVEHADDANLCVVNLMRLTIMPHDFN